MKTTVHRLPGYGIVSDCIAQGTPIIYTERGVIAEYVVLVDAIERELTSVFISSKDFSAGNWEPSIRRALSLPRRSSDMRVDGADVCLEGFWISFERDRRNSS